MTSAGAVAGGTGAPAPGVRTPAQRDRIDPLKFLFLFAQLVALLVVFRGLNTEGSMFFRLASFTVAAFAVHYFTPLRWRQWVFIALSLIGPLWILVDPARQFIPRAYVGPAQVVLVTLAAGMVFYAITRLPIDRRARVAIILAYAGALMVWRSELWFNLPDHWFKFIGALFMFRGILYTYEMYQRRAPGSEKLSDFMAYFYMLPNYYFLLFPVIDYATFKRGRGADDIHRTAQRGISWMARGAIHLALYRLLYHRLPISPAEVESFATLVRFIFPTFLLYLQISGSFHMAVGMLHLFGFKLPETNNNWLLASSFTDFWRRINIYWKDFMVKVFYYPAYFRLRKVNETAALCAATAWVFLATTVLHGYQLFWLQGAFVVTWGDAIFWSVLGALVLVNVLWENKRAKRPKKPKGRAHLPLLALRIVGVYVTISVLWSMWSARSVTLWLDTVMYWR